MELRFLIKKDGSKVLQYLSHTEKKEIIPQYLQLQQMSGVCFGTPTDYRPIYECKNIWIDIPMVDE